MMQSEELTTRFSIFFGVLVAVALAEWIFPRRSLTCSKPFRWTNNLAITFLNTLLVRLIIPLSAVAVAEIVGRNEWGILNWFSSPFWFNCIISVVVLDFIIYLQHVISHRVSLFWLIHRVHHCDHDCDVTTGLRFHPIEILLSMLLKMGVIVLIGASPTGVLLFEVLLNATAMFNHSNLRLPVWLDRCLRYFIVTPDMHRVHHSVNRRETDSNYGFNLPWWDYLCRTYCAQPCLGHEKMEIGLPEFPESDVQRLDTMLSLPFRNANSEVAEK